MKFNTLLGGDIRNIIILLLLSFLSFAFSQPDIAGCTDPTAINYNPNATIDDGSCEPVISGCTDPNFENYNPEANSDDGSCTGPIEWGCMIASACNFNPYATSDRSQVEGGSNTNCCSSGSPTITECGLDMDNDGLQDYGTETIVLASGNCGCETLGYGWEDQSNLGEQIFGCTGESSCNYNPEANVDDGSCEYEVDCAGTCGGDLEWDCAGICGGDNSSYDGCCGLPPNDDCTDDCVIDDLGQCCTPQDVDGCGICFGDGTDCECSGDLEVDCCGVCGGDNSSCSNCCGMPFPDDCSETCYEDNCGTCDADSSNDCVQDCAGVWGGDLEIDECDVCGGDNTSCQQLGDLNGDGTINVIDIVMAVDLILNDNYDLVGDVNEDGQLNVIDIVILVDWVLNGMPEADSDGDGVIDEDDSDPNNPYQCSDLDGDTCDDCSTGTFNPSDDGYDYDGDGQCDDGDCDDDNDGCQECWDYCP